MKLAYATINKINATGILRMLWGSTANSPVSW